MPSIAGHARCHRSRTACLSCLLLNLSRATHGAIDRGPRTVPSIAHRLLIDFAFKSLAGHARCHRSRATHGAIDRGPRTVPSIAHRLLIVFAFKSIAGHARCHRSRATHGTIDRGPRTVPSIAPHGRTCHGHRTPPNPGFATALNVFPAPFTYCFCC